MQRINTVSPTYCKSNDLTRGVNTAVCPAGSCDSDRLAGQMA